MKQAHSNFCCRLAVETHDFTRSCKRCGLRNQGVSGGRDISLEKQHWLEGAVSRMPNCLDFSGAWRGGKAGNEPDFS
jgi:hypothetical protein